MSDNPLIELFQKEVGMHCGALNSALIDYEKQPGDPALIETMMRAAHSLKGAARLVNLPRVSSLAHSLEDTFLKAQKNPNTLGPEHFDILLKVVDALAAMEAMPPKQLEKWPEGTSVDPEELSAQLASIGSEAPSSTKSRAQEKPQEAAAAPAEQSTKKLLGRQALQSEDKASDRAKTVTEVPFEGIKKADSANYIVRISADSLNRLLSLAAESVVGGRGLYKIQEGLLQFKKLSNEIFDQIEGIKRSVPADKALGAHSLCEELKQRVGQASGLLQGQINAFDAFSRRYGSYSTRLYHEILQSRMQPFADSARGMPRIVRDLCRMLGKKIDLKISGAKTLIDRDLSDKIEAPITQILRNACDHGIESEDLRKKAGKSPTGSIELYARHVGGMFRLDIRDDGGGIDVDALRKRVVERGLVNENVVGELSEEELFEFMFLPGFSTREQVSEISGRGVGMDIVRKVLHDIAGNVRVSSKLGEGTCFTLELPITRSVMRVLLFEIAGQPYALPLSRIEQVKLLPESDIQRSDGQLYVRYEGKAVAIVEGAELLGLPNESINSSEVMSLVIVDAGGFLYGVLVDRFLEETELVVRPMDSRLGKVFAVGASAITEDGLPVLIMDAEEWGNLVLRKSDGHVRQTSSVLAELTGQAAPAQRVLVVDDSMTVRTLEQQLLEGEGLFVDLAVDGADAWRILREGSYDLIVSDVDMPRMNGIDLLKEIRADKRFTHLPVVLVSYKDTAEDRKLAEDAGATVYLTKGAFEDSTFINTVRKVLNL